MPSFRFLPFRALPLRATVVVRRTPDAAARLHTCTACGGSRRRRGLAAGADAAQPAPGALPLLPWSQQIAIREGWLTQRHAMLLPMMRRHNVGMWIVVNEEFHDDPLSQYVAPHHRQQHRVALCEPPFANGDLL